MAGAQPTGRSAAVDPAEDEADPTPSETSADEVQPSPEDPAPETAPVQDDEEDADVTALERSHPAVVARIRTAAASAERARKAGKLDDAKKEMVTAQEKLDRAATRGVIAKVPPARSLRNAL